MSRTLASPLQKELCAYMTARRREAGLTQEAVAGRLGRHQSFIANVEGGQRRIDVIELIEIANAIGFDPRDAVSALIDEKL